MVEATFVVLAETEAVVVERAKVEVDAVAVVVAASSVGARTRLEEAELRCRKDAPEERPKAWYCSTAQPSCRNSIAPLPVPVA